MNKYQSYKPTGVEWIGEIPDNWLCSKVRFEGKIIGRIGYRGYTVEDIVSEGEGVITLSPSNITKEQKLKLSDSTYITREKYIESPEIQIFNGDIIIVKTSSLGKITIIENCNEEMTLNPQLVVYKQIKQNKKFIYYFLISNSFQYQLLVSKSGGVTPTITQEVINSFKLVIPPLQEQIQIVQFLDEKTELIDRLISTKELKITLLKEQRTSLINEVVTKGLNTDVKMKDSGTEFIGKIPENWSCTKLGFYTKKIGSGSTPRGGSEVYVDSGVPFVRSQNVHFDGLRLDGVSFIDFETHKSMKGSTVVKGDVLLNITGGSIGRCCVVEVDKEMNVNQHVSIIRTTIELLNYFLNYLLGSDIGQSQVLFNLTGGNREGLTIEGIRNFFITIPDLKEQEEIVKHIQLKTKEIDDLVDLEKKKIDLLKEYRQSLISEVVTGKIKVTN
jgi:type I restriction enzyme S subunit